MVVISLSDEPLLFLVTFHPAFSTPLIPSAMEDYSIKELLHLYLGSIAKIFSDLYRKAATTPNSKRRFAILELLKEICVFVLQGLC